MYSLTCLPVLPSICDDLLLRGVSMARGGDHLRPRRAGVPPTTDTPSQSFSRAWRRRRHGDLIPVHMASPPPSAIPQMVMWAMWYRGRYREVAAVPTRRLILGRVRQSGPRPPYYPIPYADIDRGTLYSIRHLLIPSIQCIYLLLTLLFWYCWVTVERVEQRVATFVTVVQIYVTFCC